MDLFTTTHETPIGRLFANRSERGLVSMGFAGGIAEARAGIADRDPAVGMAIERYFAGSLGALDSLRVHPRGTDLQRRIWGLLRDIPAGETRSYGELGDLLGTSGRVVGNAMAANPVCLALPCHRVIRRDGSWDGYAYGNDRKRWLLAHEAK